MNELLLCIFKVVVTVVTLTAIGFTIYNVVKGRPEPEVDWDAMAVKAFQNACEESEKTLYGTCAIASWYGVGEDVIVRWIRDRGFPVSFIKIGDQTVPMTTVSDLNEWARHQLGLDEPVQKLDITSHGRRLV